MCASSGSPGRARTQLRVMRVITRSRWSQPTASSRGAPPACTCRPTTAPHGAWLVPECGRLPRSSSTGILRGRVRPRGFRLEPPRGCPEPVHYGPVEPGTCLDRWCDGLGELAQTRVDSHPPPPNIPKDREPEPSCSDQTQAGPVSSSHLQKNISELHRQDTGRTVILWV